MKIAILADDGIGYVRPMAEGLARLLSEAGAEPRMYRKALCLLNRAVSGSPGVAGLKRTAKACLSPLYFQGLKSCSAIIVVQHLRDAFRDALALEAVRDAAPDVPIILYDLVYLPTVGLWGPWLEPGGGHMTGLDRYDWYLAASMRNRCPLPRGEHPCTQIGLQLDDGTLFPEQAGRIVALVDFERPAYPEERALQLRALQATGTEFIELKGTYSLQEIRTIYRRCRLYFLAHMESFGLPICELQACGSKVFTPKASWCDAHRLDDATTESRKLPSNIVCYENNVDRLVQEIERVKTEGSPAEVVHHFLRDHPQFFRGDLPAVRTFLGRLESGEIHARLHEQHAGLLGRVQVRPED